MSVVVAKNLQHGDAPFHRQPKVTDICPLKVPMASDHLCEMLPPYSWRPDYRPRSPGKGLVIHHESCRNIRGYQKSQRSLWLWNGIKRRRRSSYRNQGGDVQSSGRAGKPDSGINTTTSNIQSLNTEEKDGRVTAPLFV